LPSDPVFLSAKTSNFPKRRPGGFFDTFSLANTQSVAAV
jgi:hypothetical protein